VIGSSSGKLTSKLMTVEGDALFASFFGV